MPSGFQYIGEEFDRVFMTDYEIVDRFVQNKAYAWGRNGQGSVGDGTTTNRAYPTLVLGGTADWAQVDTSGGQTSRYSAGIKSDGTLWTWGSNSSGKLGQSTVATASTSSPATVSGGGTTWKQVALGDAAAAAIKTDGTLWTWGAGSSGYLGDGTLVSRTSPGTTVGGGTNWKQVSVGESNCMGAVKTDGTLWTWGTGVNGQLGNGTTAGRSSPGTTAGGGTNWKFVSCGQNCMAGIKTDGTLWTWGSNDNGVLGDGTTTSRSSPGTTAGGGTNWKQVKLTSLEASIARAIGVKTDGTLWTWGYGLAGTLGDGTTTTRSSPGTTAGGGTNWKSADISYRTAAAVKSDGSIWTWGYAGAATSGALGDGSTNVSRLSPASIGIQTFWKSVSVGYEGMIAIAD